MLRGTAPPLQLLSTGQERVLWETVLREMSADDMPLAAHAGGLMRAAVRATESLLVLSRSALSEEELLLVAVLTEVRRRCEESGWISLRLAPPESLQFLREVEPPAVAGEMRLTPLQQALGSGCWSDAALLLPAPDAASTAPQLRRYPDLDSELAACAEWCLQRLRDTGGAARLLVLTASGEPTLAVQGELLWRRLQGQGVATSTERSQLLAVEGGAPLPHIGLIASALLALGLQQPEVDTEDLFALLRSPHLHFGPQAELGSLRHELEQWSMARWPVPQLLDALASVATRNAAALRLHEWVSDLRQRAEGKRNAADWAAAFNDALAAAGFNNRPAVDSGEQQRFDRWGELLDEFSSLDAVLQPMNAVDALARLHALAEAGRHQIASADAAITFSNVLGDPVAGHDGIWVMGLTETRWPAPPRPDPYVALHEQRAQQWPEASVKERRLHAEWVLSRWRARTGELILSYPEMEGDIRHRPSPVPGKPASQWQACQPPAAPAFVATEPDAVEQRFPPAAVAPDQDLAGGMERLRSQQQCPFRSQARWRLQAQPPGMLSDGISPPQRGMLLHAILQRFWEQVPDQATLLALAPPAEHAILESCWHASIRDRALAASRWWSPGLLDRERERTLHVVTQVLQLERTRQSFRVAAREIGVRWPASGPHVRMRVDRVDETTDGPRLLIDYKSGAAQPMRLQDGELEPLQLALYVAALAARGEPVAAAALMAVKPGEVKFSGVGSGELAGQRGFKPVEDWGATAAQWERGLLDLLAAHLAGVATLATDPAACRYCHLPALCRRDALEEADDEDEADE